MRHARENARSSFALGGLVAGIVEIIPTLKTGKLLLQRHERITAAIRISRKQILDTVVNALRNERVRARPKMDQIDGMLAEIEHTFSIKNGEEVDHANAQPITDMAGNGITF